MGYLILKFEDANLIYIHSKKNINSHLVIDGGVDDIKKASRKVHSEGHDFTNPIPYTLLGNILRKLCGEVPVPTKKKTILVKNPIYDEIALNNSYVHYKNKPIFNDKGDVINYEFFQTKKFAYDSTLTYCTFFSLYDGTTKKKEGHYNWDTVRINLGKENFNKLISFIASLIGYNPLSQSIVRIVYELSKEYGKPEFVKKVEEFVITETKGKFYGWVYDVFFDYKKGRGTSHNLALKGSKTPLLINNGVGKKVSCSGTIICEITDEIADKIRQNSGTAKILDGGLIWVAGYENYEPVPNYKEFYEKIY